MRKDTQHTVAPKVQMAMQIFLLAQVLLASVLRDYASK